MPNPFTSATAGATMPTDYDVQSQQVARSRKLAELLQQQAMQQEDPNQVVAGRVVRQSPLNGLAKMAQMLAANKMQTDADAKQQAIGEQQRADFSDTAQKYAAALRGTPEQVKDMPAGQEGPPELIAPAVPGNRQAALDIAMQSRSPMWQQMGMQQMLPKDPVVVGRSLVDPRSGQVVGVDQTWQAEQHAAREQRLQEQAAAREQRMAELEQKANDAKALQSERLQAQRELRELIIASRQDNNKPYYSPVQTGDGVMSFDHRTGGITPVNVNGRPVIGSQSDPKLQGTIAGAKQRSEAEAKRDFNMNGVGDIMNRAEAVLTGKTKPTSSLVGNMTDKAAAIIGATPTGAKEADELRVLGGYLVSKMPRMEGPQSNYDVQNYKEMAGDVGNPNLPIDRRLAALRGLRGLISKYDQGAQAQPPAQGARQVRRYNPQTGALE